MSAVNKALLCMVAFGCGAPVPAHSVTTAALSSPVGGVANVCDYGAISDDGIDDRPAFKAAIDSGAAEVYVPNGNYLLGGEPGHFWAIHLATPGVRLRGESRTGVVLQEAPGAIDSVMLIEINADNVTVENMTLEGDASHQTASSKQQRHGIRFKQAAHGAVRGVTSRNFTGDGFYVYLGADDVTMEDVTASGNQRNGVTLGGNTTGGTFVNSQFVGNGAEQFDSEGGTTINNVTIYGCTLDGLGASQDFVLTMTGSTSTAMSSGWTVTNNIVNGPVLALFIRNVVYAYNTGTNPTAWPSVDIYHVVDNITIAHNDLRMTGPPSFSAGAIIWSVGTDTAQCPGKVTIENNTLSTTAPAYGVTAICNRDITIANNLITGAGGTGSAVYVRSTRVTDPVVSAVITHNKISGFTGGYGVRFGGNGDARINRAEITGNSFTGGLAAMYLDTGDHAARDIIEAFNTLSPGLAKVASPPPVAASILNGTRWTMP